MNAPTWEQIIDAVMVDDARIGPYIARAIVKADNRAQGVFPDTISPTMPHAPLSVSETPPDVETDGMDVMRDCEPVATIDVTTSELEHIIEVYEYKHEMDTLTFLEHWDSGDIERTADMVRWHEIALASGYLGTVDDDTTPLSRDGGGAVQVETAVNPYVETVIDSITDEVGNSAVKSDDASTENDADAVKSDSPKASRGGGGKELFPVPHPMKGFSKSWRKVWNWLDDHASDITHDLPTHRAVGDANGISHPTAGKILKRWRDHNRITSPAEFYQEDKAS